VGRMHSEAPVDEANEVQKYSEAVLLDFAVCLIIYLQFAIFMRSFLHFARGFFTFYTCSDATELFAFAQFRH
jgi:hypothetical protein